jgi:hypothetical protein
LPFLVIAGVLLANYYLNEYKNSHSNEFDWSKILLFVGTITQISSLTWKSIGFIAYLYTGKDYFIFHVIYLLLHSASESAIVALVCLIAFGWTLTFNYGNTFELFIPLGTFLYMKLAASH